ncbi:MAG: right-handed parallel beta-helix repeat-containing protein [Candidatus Heimdallarchaeota archaeon]|nr:right-handed parallel beta-helix repeat-containing protein [Candidatus Heimdallarchaeota archaeon]MCK4611911.1 right-handed parallel beta-helix repeat-containing protein [Candidatus Heimdallarchaeota archaeon]
MSYSVKSEDSEFPYELLEFSDSSVLISITSDQGFIDYGFSGSGTALDPYLIENYVIDSFDYGAGIHVEDTTKHFVIRNCSIKALWVCIFIRDVSDYTATITNNTCYTTYTNQLSNRGIDIRRTNGAIITNNICKYENYNYFDEYGDFGIYLAYTNNMLVDNNICLNQSASGIFGGGENNTFTNNLCSFNFWGLMVGGRNTIIKNNIITNNIEGLDTGGAEVEIDNNTIGFNERDGIMTYGLVDSEITNNVIEFNGWYGIRSWDTHRSKFTYNLIRNNTEYGVALDVDSRFNTVHHNYFIYNHIEGTSQACDSGRDNSWHDTETKKGNYWSDWDQNSTYHINGKAENNDLYPLNENLERTSSTKLYYPVTMIFLLVILLHLNRRKKIRF